MKDSGVAWIGKIPQEWKVLPAQRGFTEIKKKNVDGAIHKALKFQFGLIVPKSNFDAESDDYVADTITTYTVVEPGTVMINGLNLNYDFKTQRTGLVKETGVITSAYLALWPNRCLITSEYATYLFKGYETRMALHNMGSGIRLTLGFKEFKKQPVLFPSLIEQQGIVDFLDRRCAEIDDVIAKTQQTIEEYKKLKQAIITEAVTKGVRGPRPMKDSGVEWIGEIPAEWDRRKLKSFTVIISKGATPKDIDREFTSEYSVRYLKSENIVDNQLSEFPLFTISESINETELKRSRLMEDDLLFVIAGASLGKVAIMKSDLLPANTNQAVCFIRLKKDYSSQRKYIWYALQSSLMKTYISINSVQSAQPNISMEDIGNYYITVPSNNEQREILNYLDAKCNEIDRLIETKQQLLTELENYKKSVIYEYVTGKKEAPGC